MIHINYGAKSSLTTRITYHKEFDGLGVVRVEEPVEPMTLINEEGKPERFSVQKLIDKILSFAVKATTLSTAQTKNLSEMHDLMTEKEVAHYLRISVKPLQKSRYSGLGINLPYHKIGSLVRYHRSDVEAYLRDNLNQLNGGA